MNPLVPYLLIDGYAVDLLALFRIVFGLWAIHYYYIFGRRLDAVIYQWKTRQLMIAFFVLEAMGTLLFSALGEVPVFLAMREIGRLGIAFTLFSASRKIMKSASLAFVFILPHLNEVGHTGYGSTPVRYDGLLGGVVQMAGLNAHVYSLVSMVLVLAAIRNFSIYSKTLKPSRIEDSTRKLFLLSVLASYVLQFVGVLLNSTMLLFVELAETLAVAIGFYLVRKVAKSDETRLALQ